MPPAPDPAIKDYLRQSREAIAQAENDPAFVDAVAAIAGKIVSALQAGGKLLIAGNGGSAGDAQHIAAELVGRFALDRKALPTIALTTDTSALTAIGNDYGFEHVFERQVLALGRRGDVLLALSTSGNSPNIVAALKAARDAGLVTIGFCGSGQNAMRPLCDLVLDVPGARGTLAPASALIQQVYMTAAHLICGLVEREMMKAK